MAFDENGNGDEGEEKNWLTYRRLILAELKRISASLNALDAKIERMRSDDIGSLKVDVAMLQVKAGIWGVLGGLGVAFAAWLMKSA